jgi:hypothetical protein
LLEQHLDIISSSSLPFNSLFYLHSRPVRFYSYFFQFINQFFDPFNPQPTSTANMQFTNLFFTLLLSTAVVAKGGNSTKSTKTLSTKDLCNEMEDLQSLIKLASNTTKLEAKTKNNETKVAAIQAKASAAATTLSTMESNTTLVSACSVISAAQQVKAACSKMEDLQDTIALAANTTKLDKKFKSNATKIADFQAKATEAQTKLDAMTSNTTLVSSCSDLAAEKESKKAAASATSTSSSSKSTSSSTSGAILNARVGGVLSAVVVVAMGTLLL